MPMVNVRFQGQQGEPLLDAIFRNERLTGPLHFVRENRAPIPRYPPAVIRDGIGRPPGFSGWRGVGHATTISRHGTCAHRLAQGHS